MSILIFLLGIILGSFLNVCIYRIPSKESILCPSSNCPNCSTPLHWYDLIPLLSYIIQRGKCRYCGHRISLQYPIVEFLNGLLYLVLYNRYGLNIHFVFYAIIFSILIVISFIDLYYQIIPDSLNILILIIGIIYEVLNLKLYNISLKPINNLLGLLIPSIFFILITIVSKGGMGGGDAKLIGTLGFILGIKKVLLNMFLAFILGAIISIFLLIFKIKERKDPIPFGPFICVAFIITILWGQQLINWYTTNFL